ncbi:DMT family transporter [Thermodesulfobacteriota bacterium]
MLGELLAIISSVLIALGVVLNKKLTAEIEALALQTVRCWAAALFFLIVFFLMGRGGELIGIPLILMILMIVSMSIGIAIGDTIYIKALSMTDASRIFPVVTGGQFIPTAIIGYFTGEKITLYFLVGTVLVIGGASLVTSVQTGVQSKASSRPPKDKKWVLYCISAGLCWALSFGIMKVVLKEIDPVLANAFRLPSAAILLTGLSIGSGRGKNLKIIRYGWRAIGLLTFTGILSYCFGLLFSLYAMHISGITRLAVLTSWTPIFIMLLAAFILKEKLTIRVGLGALLSCVGTFIVMAF